LQPYKAQETQTIHEMNSAFIKRNQLP